MKVQSLMKSESNFTRKLHLPNKLTVNTPNSIKWPYYISHFILGLSFYLLIAICYNVCVKFFDLDGQWVAALSGEFEVPLSGDRRPYETGTF